MTAKNILFVDDEADFLDDVGEERPGTQPIDSVGRTTLVAAHSARSSLCLSGIAEGAGEFRAEDHQRF